MVSRSRCSCTVELAQVVLEQMDQLLGCAAEGLVLGFAVVVDGQRLVPVEPRFQHAALVGSALAAAVLVAQLHFDAGDLLVEARQRLVQVLIGPAVQGFLVLDAIAGVHLHLHCRAPFDCCDQCGRRTRPRSCRNNVPATCRSAEPAIAAETCMLALQERSEWLTLETIEIETGPNPVRHRDRAARPGRRRQRLRPVRRRNSTCAAVGPVRFVFPHAPVIPGDHQQRLSRCAPGTTSSGLDLVRREDEAGPARVAGARGGAAGAREGSAACRRPHRAGRLLAGLRDGAADRPAARRAAGRHRRHVGLPAAGADHRRRAQRRQRASRRSSWLTASRTRWSTIERGAGFARRAARAGLCGRVARVPDGALGVHGRDRRPQPLAAEACWRGPEARARLRPRRRNA